MYAHSWFVDSCVMAVVGIEIVRERLPPRYSTAVLQYRGYCSWEGLRRLLGLGALGTPAPGFAHGRQERSNFLLISCLIRLIHLLSLYREVYLTPKQATNKL